MDTRYGENQPQTENDIIEIEPIEDYNVHKAKLRASLLWLLHKAYGDEIPRELQDLYYETSEGSIHLLPRLVNLLVSSEVYCQTCSSLFRDTAYQWQGHWSIIQVLSRKGIYVMETDEVAVTATVLTQTAPFRLNAHLALIDALMTAHSGEIFTVQTVVQAVRRFTTVNASSELPSSLDDAVLFWVNKACSTILHKIEEDRKVHEQQLIQGETTQKVRITRKQLSPKELPVIEPMKDLIQDISDGCSLAATISFYSPQVLRLNDICLKRNLGIADSLFNLRLVRNFCERHLPAKIFHFEYVDLLYCHESLRQNVTAFLAELFYWFEIEKADCVTQGTSTRPSTAARLSSASKTPVPISEVTKRSFHKSHTDESPSSPPDLTRVPPSPTSNLPARQVLLPKRVNQEDGHHQDAAGTRSGAQAAHHSILAWQEDAPPVPQERRPGRKPAPQSIQQRDNPLATEYSPGVTSQSQGSNLLANVSIDSDVLDTCRSVDLDGLAESLDIDGAASLSSSPQQHRGSPGKDHDNLEILSISSTGTSTQMSNQMGLRSSVHSVKGDPLMPARLRASKEKGSNHSKAEERGDAASRKPSNQAVRKARMLPEPKPSSSTMQSADLSVRVSSGSNSSSPDDMVVTPLPDDQMSSQELPVQGPVPSHSYTIPDVASTPQAAEAAGIPVVSESLDQQDPMYVAQVQKRSRQSSVASNRSSGEFSDHESQKIHLDHKSRESAVPKEMSPLRVLQSTDERPISLPVGQQLGDISKAPLIITDGSDKGVVHTTSFAQIKKLHDVGQYDNSGFVFMQHGHDSNGNSGNRTSLKAAFQRKQAEGNAGKPEKKTSFAALPNQTTWQQNAQRMQMAGTSSEQGIENGESSQPSASELQHVRRKLEEKRRMIEREKHRMELQKSKQRQRLGKAAFLQVLSKRDGKENSIQEQPEAHMTRSAEGRVSPIPGAVGAMSTSQPNYSENMPGLLLYSESCFRAEVTLNSDQHPPPYHQPDPTGAPKTTPPLDKHSQPFPHSSPIPMTSSPRNIPALSKDEQGKEIENYDEYNSSLDKLNHSLSELQGEIMRLSLKQEQLKKTSAEPIGPVVSPAQSMAVAGQNGHTGQPSRVPPPASLWQGQTEASATQAYTSPPAAHPQAQQGAPAPFVMHSQPPVNFPASGAYTSPSQYSAGGYIPPQPPFSLQSPPMYQQMYQQSPPYPGPAGAAPFLMHVQGAPSQPYLPPSSSGAQYQAPVPGVSGYQPHPQYSGTCTVTSHSHPHTAPGSAGVPRPHQHTFQNVGDNVNPYTMSNLPEEPVQERVTSAADDRVQADLTAVQPQSESHGTPCAYADSNSYHTPESQPVQNDEHSSAGGNEGFFISFGEETPKRPKPKLGKDRHKEESYVRANLSERPETSGNGNEASDMSGHSASPQSTHSQSDANTSGIGFVVGEDNTSITKSLEDEMLKKREKMLHLQQKRREEQERKRQEKEQAEAERREKERRKQEETEQRKAEERARRDAIFQKYKERKAKDDQEDSSDEVRTRKERPRDRPRPKSMIVKTRTPIQQNGGGPVRAGNSHDDLHTSSARDLATPSPVPSGRLTPKRGKLYRPASCHLMDTSDGDPRTALPYAGSMTHRRPPSPDLYARYQNRKASSARGADSNSETGSAAGSDYAGPKLYVKPSQKSNRHIIVNAISHVCLAGTVNTDIKNKVLEEMSRSEAKHFVILFRSAGCQFRGLYTFDPDTELTFKLTGAGPRQLTNKAIETFYKYNSGAKKFNIVASTKHLSVSIDAVVVHNSVWKSSKQAKR
ncbi:LOW QUALITY PROTEIN: calmodulin-regulated spectrin-associated protein 1-like [Liolophura sinensis]|uniref:LOW QUALITY PROTEIN: calmodulin-regulated spectrin-associated protein 1-like n=1 Tax=Liolophura sinensis TaxID=3198878 RepID=UPI003158FA43